jgi:AmmeMemoRadiSam system protein B
MLYPRLRQGLTAGINRDTDCIYLFDQLRISRSQMALTSAEFDCLRLLNGRRTVVELHAAISQTANGNDVTLSFIESLIQRLDESLFLNSERFHEYLNGPVREPSCIGCYPAEAVAIREQLSELFLGDGGPGLPVGHGARIKSDGPIRALLAPHIDYGRGGVTYGWSFKELVERTDASLFVIVATSHFSAERFTLTRKHFETPLGIMPTDQTSIDLLIEYYGDGLFEDPYAHLPEHSIELEVLILQYLYADARPIRIVPLLVGSFHDCIAEGITPEDQADIERMVSALQRLEAETNEPICFIISGDLAHIGPKFGDRDTLAVDTLAESLQRDYALLERASNADRKGYFQVIANESDRRRICGLPPTWVTLAAAKPRCGKLLHYGRYVHPEGHESVSFAGMAFE